MAPDSAPHKPETDEERRARKEAFIAKELKAVEDYHAGRLKLDPEQETELERWYLSQPPEWIAHFDELGRRGAGR